MSIRLPVDRAEVGALNLSPIRGCIDDRRRHGHHAAHSPAMVATMHRARRRRGRLRRGLTRRDRHGDPQMMVLNDVSDDDAFDILVGLETATSRSPTSWRCRRRVQQLNAASTTDAATSRVAAEVVSRAGDLDDLGRCEINARGGSSSRVPKESDVPWVEHRRARRCPAGARCGRVRLTGGCTG